MDTHSLLQSDNIDPLLGCLVALTIFHRHPYSANALRAGLALSNNKLTPSVFVQAAERAGLIARIVKRPLKKISSLVLPVVLLLKDNQACVLYKIHSNGLVEIGFPDIDKAVIQKPQREIQELYTGYAIFVHPVHGVPKAGVQTAFDNPEEEVEKNTMTAWFWGTLWHYRNSYFNVILAALLINIFTVVAPLFVMNVYDRVVPYAAYVTLWVLTTGVLIVYFFDLALRLLRAYVIDVVGKKADVLLASSLFRKILNLEMTHKPLSVGAFVKNIGEFELVRDFFTSLTLTTLIDLPFALLFLFLIWYVGGNMVWVPILAIPIIVITSLWIEPAMRKRSSELQISAAKKNAVLVETVTGLEILKSLVAESVQQQKWDQEVSSFARVGLSSRVLSSVIINMSYFVQQIAYCFSVVVGVYFIANGTLSLGGLIACSILTSRALAPLVQVSNLLMRFNQARVALQGLNKFMQLPSERPAGKQFIQHPVFKGEIEFSGVGFKYPGQKTKALDKIFLKISPGEHVGVLGRMGSGKTSLQKLLLGLYKPQDGDIFIDGIDLNQYDPADLRHNIGYVPQDNILFAGTVRENILLARPWADDEQLLLVAKLAGVDNFVKVHPENYDWMIGERGDKLSGGQKQAISIARALITNAPIIIMDEPTSSADERSENELVQQLTPFMQGKTLLLVTHRLAMLRLVTRLIVLHEGKIVLDGPRDEVLKRLSTPTQPNPEKQ